jgi:hypothetical protein
MPAARPQGAGIALVEPVAPPVAAEPAFHQRSLMAEGLSVAFRVDAGSGFATGSLPAGAGENEIAKFLGEAMGFAKQMRAAMGGPGGTAAVHILIADPKAAARQSAIEVAVAAEGGAVVTTQPEGSSHLTDMLQHFLMALNAPPSRSGALTRQ